MYNANKTIKKNQNNLISNSNSPNSKNTVISNPKDYYMNLDIPNKKPKNKIDEREFTIPLLKDYNNIITINYNLTQLKNICKSYNLKTSGNKEELKKRIYNNLYFSYYATYIQKITRKIIVKNYIALHGPAFQLLKRSLCVNDTDFVSLDSMNEIPYTNFFSIIDENKFIYGFDIKSIYNLYLKNNDKIENPYTTKIFSCNVYDTMMEFIKYSNLLSIELDMDYGKIKELSKEKKLEMKILSLFQEMDSLGNYTNMSWFTVLNKYELIKFIRELLDIWNYRANLSNETKRNICHPHGNPFRKIGVNYNYLNTYSYKYIKKNVIYIMDEFINKGINNEYRQLGCYYILSGLTLVNPIAAEDLPWLYESVNYEQQIIN